jgi:NAD(P)-dependent dehydrogenase (short-subunit alcohol dehydrogenase family)
MEQAGKVCLITGGASGIGAMTALAFSRRVAQIAATGLGGERPIICRSKTRAVRTNKLRRHRKETQKCCEEIF